LSEGKRLKELEYENRKLLAKSIGDQTLELLAKMSRPAAKRGAVLASEKGIRGQVQGRSLLCSKQ
jgi:hypothetical protein